MSSTDNTTSTSTTTTTTTTTTTNSTTPVTNDAAAASATATATATPADAAVKAPIVSAWNAAELASKSTLESASCIKIDDVPHIRYFAIGAMINPTSLRYRNIFPISSQPGILRGYRLTFEGAGGMASIMPDEHAHFHGVLHLLTATQMLELDKIESVYGRMDVPIELYDGTTVIGSVYKFDPTKLTFTVHNPPSERYIDIITRGCKHYGVHQSHIDWLAKQPTVPRKKEHEMLSLPEPPENQFITRDELAKMDGIDGRPLAWSVNGKALRVRSGDEHMNSPYIKINTARVVSMKLGGKEIVHIYSRMIYDPMFPEVDTWDEMPILQRRLMEDQYVRWSNDSLPHLEVFARVVKSHDDHHYTQNSNGHQHSTTKTSTTSTTTENNANGKTTTTTTTTATHTDTDTNGSTTISSTTTTVPSTSSSETITSAISMPQAPTSTPTSASSLFIDGVPHVRYFAIGSMINPTSLRYRGLTPTSSMPGILHGYKLIFAGIAGMASIAYDETSHFHGVVHLMTHQQMDKLDSIEGPYGRMDVEVELYDASRVIASVYKLDPAKTHHDNPHLPSERYLDVIIRGCKHYGVHESHLEWLSKQPCQPRPKMEELKTIPEPPEGKYITKEELLAMDGRDDRPIAWSVNGKVLQLLTPIPDLPPSIRWFIQRWYDSSAGKEIIHGLSQLLYDPKYPEATCHDEMADEHQRLMEDHLMKHLGPHLQHFNVIARIKKT